MKGITKLPNGLKFVISLPQSTQVQALKDSKKHVNKLASGPHFSPQKGLFTWVCHLSGLSSMNELSGTCNLNLCLAQAHKFHSFLNPKSDTSRLKCISLLRAYTSFWVYISFLNKPFCDCWQVLKTHFVMVVRDLTLWGVYPKVHILLRDFLRPCPFATGNLDRYAQACLLAAD